MRADVAQIKFSVCVRPSPPSLGMSVGMSITKRELENYDVIRCYPVKYYKCCARVFGTHALSTLKLSTKDRNIVRPFHLCFWRVKN